MELLLKLTPPNDIQQHVLPMLYRGLDSDSPQIHELCLSVLPTFAGLLDHGNVKNSVLPRVKKLCLSTTSLSVRVNCLVCIGRLLEHLDKWLVLDEVLPFLPQIPSREPAVLMGILGIYKLSMTHKKLGITKEVMATRVLPFLIPLCIENGLTLQQFNALVALVKQMFQLVETEHRTKLEQLNSVQEQQKILENTMPAVTPQAQSFELDQVFSSLGLDNFSSTSLSAQNKQQNTMKLLQSQSSLEPIPVAPNKNQTQTKDLSVTLTQLDSQLWHNACSVISPLSSSIISPPPSSVIAPPPSSKTFSSNVNNNLTSINKSFPVPRPTNMNLNFQTQNQWINNNKFASQQPFNSTTTNQFVSPLHPTTSTSNNRNIYASSTTTSSTTATALSKEEIMDFLS